MSTRAVYSFRDREDRGALTKHEPELHVYKHHDGYPSGAAIHLTNALLLAWTLPRFEADDFAAAFVAANKLPYWAQTPILEALAKPIKDKNTDEHLTVEMNRPGYSAMTQGGGVRLMASGPIHEVAPSDIEYRYEIFPDKKGKIMVHAFGTNYWDNDRTDTFLFKCPLKTMVSFVAEWEKRDETTS